MKSIPQQPSEEEDKTGKKRESHRAPAALGSCSPWAACDVGRRLCVLSSHLKNVHSERKLGQSLKRGAAFTEMLFKKMHQELYFVFK